MLKHIPEERIYKLDFAELEPKETNDFELTVSEEFDEKLQELETAKNKWQHYSKQLDQESIHVLSNMRTLIDQYNQQIQQKIDQIFVNVLTVTGICSLADLLVDLKNGAHRYNQAIPYINEAMEALFSANPDMWNFMFRPIFSTIPDFNTAMKIYQDLVDKDNRGELEELKRLWKMRLAEEDKNDC